MNEAIIRSMKMYWKNDREYEGLETTKNRKYNKKYFDSIKSSVLGGDTESDKKLEKDLK